ncbi:MAG: zinc-binding dehydrogenase, partial [Armatimonadota bacterium]|nr:zinc-binding dehydrogenase [Armatimonadota bacterium]
RASMLGMMDTVLNLGLNDITVEALAKSSGDRRFAFDTSGAPNWWSLTMLNPDEPSAHEEVCALVAAGKLALAPFVTHTFPFAQFANACATLENPHAVKVVITF